MVFPNFFITFVRHSFHTSHPSTSPLSRETASPCHQTPHSPHGTRHASRAMHTCCTSQKAMLTRHASSSLTAHPPTLQPSQKAMLTRHAHATHPHLSQHTRPHTTTPAKGYATRAALPHTTHALHTTPPAKGYATHTPHAQKCRNAFPCSPLLSKKKERASTTKILHITILHVTFTRIGVKTTQKSEAIFSFID